MTDRMFSNENGRRESGGAPFYDSRWRRVVSPCWMAVVDPCGLRVLYPLVTAPIGYSGYGLRALVKHIPLRSGQYTDPTGMTIVGRGPITLAREENRTWAS